MSIEAQLTTTFLKKILLSLVVGALLGLEREYTKRQKTVGIRTFSLISLLGTVVAIMAKEVFHSHIPVFIGIAAACGFSIMLYFTSIEREYDPGFTTNVAIILVYILGTMIGFSRILESVFVGVIVAIVLYSKRRTHKIVRHMSKKELNDLLEFAVILGIVYPLLPAEPLQVVGITLPLHTVWYLIVLISLINFVTFIGSRYLETKYEIPIISFFGGLLSSTGTVGSLATQYRDNKNLKSTVAAGVLFATSALIIKTLGITSILVPSSAKYLIPPLILGLIPLMIFAYKETPQSSKGNKLKIESPFNITKAAEFGLAILILITLVEVTSSTVPQLIIVTAFLAGIVSSTSMTLSLITLTLEGAILLPTLIIGIIVTTIGSLTGNYTFLFLGKAKEIIKETWRYTLLSAALLTSSFLLLIYYL